MRRKTHLLVILALLTQLLLPSFVFIMAEETAPNVIPEGSVETAPAAPTETPAPPPTETPVPQPMETQAPQPTETQIPQPVETQAPQPTETQVPQPAETQPPQSETLPAEPTDDPAPVSPTPPTEIIETTAEIPVETVQPLPAETSTDPQDSVSVSDDTSSAAEPQTDPAESTADPAAEEPVPETESVEETPSLAVQPPTVPANPTPRPAAPTPPPVVLPAQPAVRLDLYPAECTLQVGGTCSLTWELSDGSRPTQLPVFSTSNSSIATVNKDGTITAMAPGTAVITAVYNGQSDSCKVTVNAEPAFILSAKTKAGEVVSSLIGSGYVLFLPDSSFLKDLVLTSTESFSSAQGVNLSKDKKTLTGSFTSGDSFTVTLSGTDVTQTVTVLASDLPALNVSLKDATLEEVQKDKNIKYKGNSLVLYDPTAEEYALSAEDIEFKGRGNSSWRDFEKKGYQIRFSEKTSVLGMPEAKKWCLVPNAGDSSMMRNILAYQLAASGDLLWSPSCTSINLWIDGVYQGLYLLTEKVEIGKRRLPLTEDDSILVEMDNAFYTDEDLWYCSEISGMYYVCKDAANDDTEAAAFEKFKKNITSFEKALNNGASYTKLCSYIDMKSFAEFYLINELTDNREVLCTSCYFYTQNGKIYAGPVWDFDSALGTDPQPAGTNYLITHGSNGSYQTNLFRLLAGVPEFADLVARLYAQVYEEAFRALPETVESLEKEFSAAADMNNTRWRSALGAATSKGNIVASSFTEGVKELQDWLSERIDTFLPLDQFLKVEGNGRLQTFSFTDEHHAYSAVRAAIWNIDEGQDSRIWFTLQDSDAGWSRVLDLGPNASGTYTVHLYGAKEDDYILIGHLDFSVRTRKAPLIGRAPSFEDTTNTSAFYYKALTWAVQNDLVEDSRAAFEPSGACSAADAVVWLWRATESPSPLRQGVYTDLKAGSELDSAASWALENGLYIGKQEGLFAPGDTLTRGEFISILYHGAVRSLGLSDPNHPSTEKEIIAWAVDEELAAVSSADDFDASDVCTRAQVLTFLYRFFHR